MLPTRFCLLAALALGLAHAGPMADLAEARRLGLPEPRRRDIIDDVVGGFEFLGDGIMEGFDSMGDFFIDFGEGVGDLGETIGEGFLDAWGETADFFAGDFVDFWTDDFVGFWVDFGEAWADIGAEMGEGIKDGLDATGDVFVDGWDGFVDGMEIAADWTADAAVTAWSATADFFEFIGCATLTVFGEDCTSCISGACNDSLDKETIAKIQAANALAVQDMEGSFDELVSGCATALEGCPSFDVCNEMYNMSEAAKVWLVERISQCNVCYQCLPFGSTQEGCKKILDIVMPDQCAGCTAAQQNMFNAFYSCSAIKVVHDSIASLGASYKEGADGREQLNQMCNYCKDCSDYEDELDGICSEWTHIKGGWDMKPPEIPASLTPPMVVINEDPDPPAPKGDWKEEYDAASSDGSSDDDTCKLPIELAIGAAKGKKAGKPSKEADACACAFRCTAEAEETGAVAWIYKASKKKGKNGKCTCLSTFSKAKCKKGTTSGLMGDEDLLKKVKKQCK